MEEDAHQQATAKLQVQASGLDACQACSGCCQVDDPSWAPQQDGREDSGVVLKKGMSESYTLRTFVKERLFF